MSEALYVPKAQYDAKVQHLEAELGQAKVGERMSQHVKKNDIPDAAIRSAAEFMSRWANHQQHARNVSDCNHCNGVFLATWALNLLSEYAALEKECDRAKDDTQHMIAVKQVLDERLEAAKQRCRALERALEMAADDVRFTVLRHTDKRAIKNAWLEKAESQLKEEAAHETNQH